MGIIPKSFWTVLGRALRRLCPACGKSPIFLKSLDLHEKCPSCGFALRDREPNTYFLMYVSAAMITGVFLLLMLFWLPANVPLARAAVIVVAAAAFLLSMPLRKSLAIAFEYLTGGGN